MQIGPALCIFRRSVNCPFFEPIIASNVHFLAPTADAVKRVNLSALEVCTLDDTLQGSFVKFVTISRHCIVYTDTTSGKTSQSDIIGR